MSTLSRGIIRTSGIALMALGVAGLIFWFGYYRNAAAESQGCTNSVSGNNSGTMTNSCNNTTINLEDKSIKKRIRDLFSTIDSQINKVIDNGQTDISIRMQPSDLNNLRSLIAEAGADSPVQITGTGKSCIDCTLSNGTLGPQGAVHEQMQAFLHISPSLQNT